MKTSASNSLSTHQCDNCLERVLYREMKNAFYGEYIFSLNLNNIEDN